MITLLGVGQPSEGYLPEDYFSAAGIVDVPSQDAWHDYVDARQAVNKYGSITAVYPIIGGSASSHKYNAIYPENIDAAKRLTFYGGITHSATGMVGNATTGYADTHIIPEDLPDGSFSIYVGTNDGNTMVDIGALWATDQFDVTPNLFQMNLSFAGELNVGYNSEPNTTYTNADTRGFYTVVKNGTNLKAYKNGVQILNNTIVEGTIPYSIFLMARNSGTNSGNGPTFYSSRSLRFVQFEEILTGAEVAALYTDVQTLQTALSRNV